MDVVLIQFKIQHWRGGVGQENVIVTKIQIEYDWYWVMMDWLASPPVHSCAMDSWTITWTWTCLFRMGRKIQFHSSQRISTVSISAYRTSMSFVLSSLESMHETTTIWKCHNVVCACWGYGVDSEMCASTTTYHHHDRHRHRYRHSARIPALNALLLLIFRICIFFPCCRCGWHRRRSLSLLLLPLLFTIYYIPHSVTCIHWSKT